MKHILLSLHLILIIQGITWCQNYTPITNKKNSYSTPSKDYVMFQLGYDGWLNKPDSIKTTSIGRAINLYICYDFQIQKSNFSFAAGAGIGSSNIYLKDQVVVLNDTNTAIQFIKEPINYKRYKFSTSYLEAPFEFRYFENKENRNEGIKAAIGLRVGALVNAHSKGKRLYNNKPIVEKVVTRRYLETWRIAATARIGWGNFSLFGTYNLNRLFRVGSGPQTITPFSLGICLSGL